MDAVTVNPAQGRNSALAGTSISSALVDGRHMPTLVAMRRRVDAILERQGGSEGASVGDGSSGCSCGCSCQALGPLLSTKEAAVYLGVSPEYLEKLRTYGLKRGAPPRFTRIGRRVAYQRAELDAFIARNCAETNAEYHPHG